MESIEAELNKLTKKQKLLQNFISNEISLVMDSIMKAREACARASKENSNLKSIASDLNNQVQSHDTISKVNKEIKSYHVAISKCSKTVDKNMCNDITKIYRQVTFDRQQVNSLIAKHLYRQGQFLVADSFILESTTTNLESFKNPYIEIYLILSSLKQKDLQPAIRWVKEHRVKLLGNSLEYKLTRLRFLDLIQKSTTLQIPLQYARENFPLFIKTDFSDIKRLMGSILYFNKLEKSPYQELFAQSYWDDAYISLLKACCKLHNHCFTSYLSTCLSVGIQALPSLYKMVNVIENRSMDWDTIYELPVEVPLNKEMHFHSIFACPVSGDKTIITNPPVLLKCGHVICKACVSRLLKHSLRFKCPTCPMDQTLSATKDLKF